ncbi:YbaB/EbfC family nucleoid-associated protein [Ethanoligenens harbinense]|uniref:Nucleoid-associated protein Ethha_0166 n=1 Tax=Ethanoligenens harbinense (strain DSM 18485 / JCM 12961 / CGMCC 1.5033 / YUAN-3) TaxID=663278 RepID=E6U6M0_ETHHY|nr:YbaB/EbfC family nucleoid-associated protein [Ethanoligenens harbinense]ADU25753.1 Uncharacterized protein family UPF0133 [Ethanoligenens harbinense YUAN-3]AVQ94924.1 nucleoid-associated protein, YbaB/EbfC family [Ethanoligenens harbinense YUAN-3]AYF37616.1 nucleoid-associated protein, YbaB/EbfC family [Ethanoligenens harbinense]AYF40336.1 nucleoid-associated protein, YbaB/EbfC family [Ethanoligenens harbinense]QCN91172.1 YbaB/EbfC family nucleoid-associated protein [Ethanoligenens harbinen
MKARLPKGYGGGSSDMNSMIKQAQKMQEAIGKVQAELDEREYTVTSGGGMVEVQITGKREIKQIHIKPEAVDPDDIEMLQDLIVAGVNEAIRKVDETAEQEMGKVTGGLNMPGLI